MLGSVVLAGDVVTVDVPRAIGVLDCLAGSKSRRIERELIERAIDITGCELRATTCGVIIGAIDRAVAVDRLPEGEIAVGKEAFDQRGNATGADDVELGCVILAGNC